MEKLKILLLGVDSPSYYSLFNYLPCECLAGDLRGYFGADIKVEIIRISHISDVDMLCIYFSASKPSIIGISMQLGSLHTVDCIVKCIIKSFNMGKRPLLVFGNQIATFFPADIIKRYLDYGNVIAVMGEGEIALRKLTLHMLGKVRLSDIESIAYFDVKLNTIIENECVTPDLSELVYPPSMDTCIGSFGRSGKAMIQASRGCAWGECGYCTSKLFRNGKDWESFSFSRIEQNISSLAKQDIDKMEFCDDDFFGGRDFKHLDRIHRIASFFEKCAKPIAFGICTRPAIIYQPDDAIGNKGIKDILHRLKKSGLCRIYLEVESGSESQMCRFKKVGSVSQSEKAIRIIRDFEIGLDVGFIMFDPNVSLKELKENISFFKRNNLALSNHWPFRPLVLSKGCNLFKRLDIMDRNTEVSDITHNFYRYTFKDRKVQLLSDIINKLFQEGRPYSRLIYGLKVISSCNYSLKKFAKKDHLSKQYLVAHTTIFLQLMEKLCDHFLDHSIPNRQHIRSLLFSSMQSIMQLIIKISVAVENGDLADPDNYLQNQLDLLKIENKVPKYYL